MATTITNQAEIAYTSGQSREVAFSNVAETTIRDPLSVSKLSLDQTYRRGDDITFIVSVSNNSTSAQSNVTVTDDLGTYQSGTLTVTPYTYSASSALFIDGVYQGSISPSVAEGSIQFTIPSLGAGSNAQIVYEATVNGGAPFEAGSSVTNTVTAAAAGITETATAEATVSAEEYASVTVNKSMSASGSSDSPTLTYVFELYNYGNGEASDIVLSDAFSPAPQSITVYIDGELVDPANYTYTGGTLTLPTGSALSLSLPAASTVTGTAGEITVIPSSKTVTVTGTV